MEAPTYPDGFDPGRLLALIDGLKGFGLFDPVDVGQLRKVVADELARREAKSQAIQLNGPVTVTYAGPSAIVIYDEFRMLSTGLYRPLRDALVCWCSDPCPKLDPLAILAEPGTLGAILVTLMHRGGGISLGRGFEVSAQFLAKSAEATPYLFSRLDRAQAGIVDALRVGGYAGPSRECRILATRP